MTQQEIQERNKQIALMLGKTKSTVSTLIAERMNEKEFWLPNLGIVKNLYFHSDWKWLMEAVEFIEEKLKLETVISNMGFGSSNQYININRGISVINETYDNPSKIMGKASTKKEAVFMAVSDFAKLYNEGKL